MQTAKRAKVLGAWFGFAQEATRKAYDRASNPMLMRRRHKAS